MALLPTISLMLGWIAGGRAGLTKPFLSTQSVRWTVSDNRQLVWNGTPELPIGLRIPGTVEAIDQAAGAGVTDLCVNVPVNGASWPSLISDLESRKCKYLLSINSLWPAAEGYSIEPEGYRIAGITEKRRISFDIPGASSVLAVLATLRDGQVQFSQQVTTPGGHFELTVEPPNDLENVLLLYPKLNSLAVPDLWDEFDSQRDQLLASLKQAHFGAGFRGLLNPLGALPSNEQADPTFVPSSRFFRFELESYLRNKYHTVETAEKLWGMHSSDVNTFPKLSRLVPLWVGAKGLAALWDPKTDSRYPIDRRTGPVWTDIHQVLADAKRRRYARLANAVRQLIQAPVLQEWTGWGVPFEGQPLVDGIGITPTSNGVAELLRGSAEGASSVLRWPHPGLLVASRLSIMPDESESDLNRSIEELLALGTRGVYISSSDPKIIAMVPRLKQVAMNSNSVRESPAPLFYPENATNPAVPQQLPGGRYWLPIPYDGNRIDYGSLLSGYEMVDGSSRRVVIWANSAAVETKLRLAQPKLATITNGDGSPVAMKVVKNGIIVTVSTTPIIVTGQGEIPVPESALDELNVKYAALSDSNSATKIDVSQEVIGFKDALSAFDKTPGDAYQTMLSSVHALTIKLAPYTWIEAESLKNPEIGTIVSDPSCSGQAVFRVSSNLSLPSLIRRWTYSALRRSIASQDVWIAAKIDPVMLASLRVVVGGQVMQVTGSPVSFYGNGYAWYPFGSTKLVSGRVEISLEMDASGGANFSIDAIVLSPEPFRPNNVQLPLYTLAPSPDAPKKGARKH